MKVKDVIAALSKLDPELYVCGNSSDEMQNLFSEVSPVSKADNWHDSLPEGEMYVHMRFNEAIPHTRGDGTVFPEPPPKPRTMKCDHCGTIKIVKPDDWAHCQVCNWKPMMKEVENYAEDAASGD